MQSAASGQFQPLTGESPCPEAGQPGSRPTLHRAAWLVPVVSPPLRNGAVLVHDGQILAAGSHHEVKAASPSLTREVDHGSAAIMPGLVNAHTHLELSGLQGGIALPQDSFAQWLTALLALRPLMTQGFLEQGLARGQQGLLAGGCCLCGDITNGACLTAASQVQKGALPGFGSGCHRDAGGTPAPPPHPSPLTPYPHLTRQVFLEVLGFDREHLDDVLGGESTALLEMPGFSNTPLSLAAHACYSTAGAVIREAKEWCRARGRWFSIHVAEHPEEIEFLAHGTGFCREVLDALGRWNPWWRPPGTSPVKYLERLHVLDAQTLLVHAVHLSDDDWDLVVSKRCPVCFCPRSNRNLQVGEPDLAKALRYGLTVALGTDSLASNTDLDLFAEAAHVLDHYPDVPSAAVIHMATLGGARALGHEQRFGSIEPGKQAALLAVSIPASLPSRRLFEMIVYQGTKGAWQWLHHPANRCDWAESAI